MINRMCVESPLGPLTLTEENGSIVRLEFAGCGEACAESAVLREARAQLTGYFAGERRAFNLPLAPSGTPFQQAVWQALGEIPYGQTRSYGDIARAVGREKACRAVGMANHRNPIPVIIPCHRVIGADGSLAGYGGGTDIKRFLLRLEGLNP